MPRLNQQILINGKELNFFTECQIVTSKINFTDTAIITLPNRISAKGLRISDVLKKGSVIEIKLGYFPFLKTEFTGYIANVIPEKTATIYCENEAYIYKRKPVGKDIIKKNTTVKDLIQTVYSDELEAIGSNIGDWSISRNSTLLDILSELQSKFRIYSYFRDKTLVVGAQADTTEKNNIPVDFQKNVPLGESSISFNDIEINPVAVKVSTISRTGAITQIFALYDESNNVLFQSKEPDGYNIDEISLSGQNTLTADQLKELAVIRLQAISGTKIDGEAVIYGNNSAKHGDIAVIKNNAIPEMNGSYDISEIVKTSSVSGGFRQALKLGLKVG